LKVATAAARCSRADESRSSICASEGGGDAKGDAVVAGEARVAARSNSPTRRSSSRILFSSSIARGRADAAVTERMTLSGDAT